MATTLSGIPTSPIDRKISEQVAVLQLSDLHFVYDTDVEDKTEPPQQLLMAIQSRIKVGEKFDLIVVTGDLVDGNKWSVKKHAAALHHARTFLELLCKQVGVDPANGGIRVVPGNHDVRIKGFKSRRKFAAKFIEKFGDWMSHMYYPNLNLFIGCFDSNRTRRWPETANGRVEIQESFEGLNGLELQQRTKNAFNRTQLLKTVRLALVHHHPMPIANEEESTVRSRQLRWRDRVWPINLIGKPETLLLRNAGTFLEQLMVHGFDLVLHGHLHYRKSWLVIRPDEAADSRSFDDREGHFLNVYACGSSGVEDRDKNLSFNVLRVHDDASVEAHNYAFPRGADGTPRVQSHPLSVASREFVRLSRWNAYLAPFRAEKVEVRTRILFPGGDREEEWLVRGIRANEGSPTREFSVKHKGRSQGFVKFELIHPPEQSRQVSVRTNWESNGDHCVQVFSFDDSIMETPVDLRFRYLLRGVVFPSRQARRFAEDDPEKTTDEFFLRLRQVACKQMTMVVEFPPEYRDYKGFHLAVSNDLSVPSEPVISKESGPDNFTFVRRRSGPMALIHVRRPRTGWGYGVFWDIPERDPIPRHIRKFVEYNYSMLNSHRDSLARDQLPPSARLAAVRFCDEVQSRCRRILAPSEDPGRRDEEIFAYLFGFRESDHHLIPVARGERASDFYAGTKIKWGREVIGKAFRRRDVYYFSRKEYEKNPYRMLCTPPPQIEVLLAVPIVSAVGWLPIGVVALATSSTNSLLLRLHPSDNYGGRQPEEKDYDKQIVAAVGAIWNDIGPAVLGPD